MPEEFSVIVTYSYLNEIFHIRIPKGRTITKLKSDIASSQFLPLSQVVLIYKNMELNNANQKIETIVTDKHNPLILIDQTIGSTDETICCW